MTTLTPRRWRCPECGCEVQLADVDGQEVMPGPPYCDGNLLRGYGIEHPPTEMEQVRA